MELPEPTPIPGGVTTQAPSSWPRWSAARRIINQILGRLPADALIEVRRGSMTVHNVVGLTA